MLVAFMTTQLSKYSTHARPLGSTTDCTAAHGLEDEQSAHASATLPCMDECELSAQAKVQFRSQPIPELFTPGAVHTCGTWPLCDFAKMGCVASKNATATRTADVVLNDRSPDDLPDGICDGCAAMLYLYSCNHLARGRGRPSARCQCCSSCSPPPRCCSIRLHRHDPAFQ